MRIKIATLFCVSFLLFTCGDGDIITLNLEFDQQLELCGNVSFDNYEILNDDYVVFDIKEDPNESLILLFTGSSSNDLIFFPEESPYNKSISIGSSSRFNYRTYNGYPLELICEAIPSSSVSILNDYEATSGTIETETTFEDVDGTRTVIASFTVVNFDLEVLNSTSLFIGTYTHTYPTPD